MEKKNEKATELLGKINKALGEDNSLELLHILRKQGRVSEKQWEELARIQRQALDKQRLIRESILDAVKVLKVKLPDIFDVKVSNQKDFPVSIKISNLGDIKFPGEVGFKKPSWFSDLLAKWVTFPIIKSLNKQLQDVNITGPRDPKKAIAVRLSDGENFYKAVMQAVSAAASNSLLVEQLLQQILSAQGGTPTLANRYIVTTNEINTGTGEVDICIVKNPSGSGKNVRIEQVLISSQDAGQRTFRLYRNAVISANGTALPINGMKTSQDLSIASAFKSPTITSKGSLIFGGNFGEGAPLQTLSVPFIVLPNENLLITSQSTSDRIFLSLVWIEE